MYPSVKIADEALLRANLRGKHDITLVCTYMTNDDKDVHAECLCGWKGKDHRANYAAHKEGLLHLQLQVRG